MSARATVLVIDDDQDCRASIRYLLEDRGYSVIEAGGAREGLKKVTEQRPDLILLDVMMECDSAGYSVAHAIKYREEFSGCRNVPVIMLSSIQESPDQLFAMSPESEMIRPDLYLAKPLDATALTDAVERLLEVRPSPAVKAS